MSQLNKIVADIAAENIRYAKQPASRQKRTGHPFITISRQASAGGDEVKDKLVERLRQVDPGEPAWAGFDRELVEKVSEDHNLSARLIESLEESSYNWLGELIRGFDQDRPPSDVAVYRRVAKTVFALAQAGRVVIVGRGGAFLTRGLPGGIHIRLVAPFDVRAERFAKANNLSQRDAERGLRELEERRANFYKRFWPSRSLTAENFTVTFNTAQVDDAHVAESVLPLIPGVAEKVRPAAKASGR
jgi:cytidylate kinase